MKRRINYKTFIKNNYTWIISSLIVLVYMYIFMRIYKVTPFGSYTFVNSDCYHQMYPMLAHLQYVLKNGGDLSYYWNSGLGGDFLPTYFYYIASPINLLVAFIDKSNLQAFISITVAIKIGVSAGTFGFYISRRTGEPVNNPFYIAVSCAYALCNYMCSYYFQIMWFDALLVFPLIILGFIKLRNNNPFLYILSLAYSMYCNYYISFAVCIFLVLLFLIDKYKSITDFIKRGLLFAANSILAAGISAVPLIVSFIGLTKTGSNEEQMVSHRWYGNIFYIIRQQFILSNPYTTSINDNDANIYCGTFVILFIFLYLLCSKISIVEKVKKMMLMVLLLISMNESILNYIWHGFHEQHSVPNRFAILYIFVLLNLSVEAYDNIKNISLKSIVVSVGGSVLFPILCYFFYDFNSILSSHQIIGISIVLIFIYALFVIILSLCNQKRINIVLNYIISIVILVEIIFNSLVVLKLNLVYPLNENTIFQLLDSVSKEVKEQDNSLFYRADYENEYFNNINLYCDINGIGGFNSTSCNEPIVFLQLMGNHTGKNRVLYTQSKNYLDDLLGVKYIISTEGSHNYDYDENYELINDQNGLLVYKNNNALSLGYGVNKDVLNYEYSDKNEISKNVNSLYRSLCGGEDIISQINPEWSISYDNCEIGLGDTEYLSIQCEDYDNNTKKRISIGFDIDEEASYFVDVRCENENLISFKINGELFKESIWFSNGLNNIGKLSKNDNVEIIISDNMGHLYQKNNAVDEIKIFVYRVNMDNIQKMVDYLADNQFEVNSFTNSNITGHIRLDNDKILLTSIPFDNGWHVYENGREIKTVKLAHTFLGVDVGPGEHDLEFKFITEGFYPGVAISVVSSIIFIIICIKHCKKRNNSKEVDDREKEDSEEDNASVNSEIRETT